jgi:hypothetical protein
MRRPYVTETALEPGTAVVQGTKDNTVKAPASDGTGDFIGVYAFEENDPKDIKDTVGVAITGVVKVLAGGAVHAGKKAVIADDDADGEVGSLVELPATAGTYNVVGIFLESGATGDYVDMLIERSTATVTA